MSSKQEERLEKLKAIKRELESKPADHQILGVIRVIASMITLGEEILAKQATR